MTLDLIDLANAQPEGHIMVIGVISRKLSFMPNGAELAPTVFDFIVDNPAGTHDVFAPPNMKVSLADYALGLYASSVVKDRGTLQIGIGSLGDAIAQALMVRDRDNYRYRQIMAELLPAAPSRLTELAPFAQGLYGCSEMFVNGFPQLIEAGIVRREVFPHAGLRRLVNAGKIGMQVTARTLAALREALLVSSKLSPANVELLRRFGIFKPDVEWQDGELVLGGLRFSVDLDDAETFAAVTQHYLGETLAGVRSILMLRATRTRHDKAESNIVWNYAHTTIPRHLRDLVVTEYGMADLRGQGDGEVITRLLAIADSRFQRELLAAAIENRKLAADYEIPDAQRHNLSALLEAKPQPWRDMGLLPDFPFGTDFTEDELAIVRSLQRLKHSTEHPIEFMEMVFNSLVEDKHPPEKYIERMHFEQVHSLKDWVMKKPFVGNLQDFPSLLTLQDERPPPCRPHRARRHGAGTVRHCTRYAACAEPSNAPRVRAPVPDARYSRRERERLFFEAMMRVLDRELPGYRD